MPGEFSTSSILRATVAAEVTYYRDDDDDYIIVCLVYYMLLHIHGAMQESYQTTKSVAMKESSSSRGVSKKTQGKICMTMMS